MSLEPLRLLIRALAPVLYAHAQYQQGFAKGFALGRSIHRRYLARPTVEFRCPHCGKLDYWDREVLGILAMVAEDQEHRRELWLAHTAGVHGHARPCACGAPAIFGEVRCCDCQAKIARVS